MAARNRMALQRIADRGQDMVIDWEPAGNQLPPRSSRVGMRQDNQMITHKIQWLFHQVMSKIALNPRSN